MVKHRKMGKGRHHEKAAATWDSATDAIGYAQIGAFWVDIANVG